MEKKIYTLDEIKAKIEEYSNICRECREMFKEKARQMVKDAPRGKVFFDPDATFRVMVQHKHSDYTGDAVAVSFADDGRILFDVASEYDYEKGLYLADDACYGVYVDDWAWALQVLLEHEQSAYEHEEEENDN